MRILAIGDVTDERGVCYLESRLWDARRELNADLVLVNAENAGFITGANPEQARRLLSAGADVLTGGNHTLSCTAMQRAADGMPNVLRPLNLPDAPGAGSFIAEARGYRVLVVNLIGRALSHGVADCPFRAADRVLERESGRYDVAVVDFHAEASGEKLALGHYLDGRAALVFGTHTHVPTADETVLPGGCAYITDIGMCGPVGSILGSTPQSVIRRYLSGVPYKLEAGQGEISAGGIVADIDVSAGRATAIRRVKI